MQTNTLLRGARRAIARMFSLGGVVGRKKFTLKPLKKEVNSNASKAVEENTKGQPRGTIEPENEAFQSTDLAQKPLKRQFRPKETGESRDEGIDDHRRSRPRIDANLQQEPDKSLLSAVKEARESFRNSTSDLGRKLKSGNNQISKASTETHGEEFRVFATENPSFEREEQTKNNQLTIGFGNPAKDRAHQGSPKSFEPNKHKRFTDAHKKKPPRLEEDPELMTDLENNNTSSAFILSEAAKDLEDDPSFQQQAERIKTNIQEVQEQTEARTASRPRSAIVIFDDPEELDDPNPKPADLRPSEPQNVPQETQDAPRAEKVFKFSAERSAPKPKIESEAKEERKATTTAQLKGSSVTIGTQPVFQTKAKQQQPDKPLKTLTTLDSLSSDEAAEKAWHRFAAFRDDMFFGSDHDQQRQSDSEVQLETEDAGQSSYSELTLKWEVDSTELLERFMGFSHWAKQLLLHATNQIQRLHEVEDALTRGRKAFSAKSFTQDQNSEFNPLESLYFQSLVIGVEEVVNSISNQLKSFKDSQNPLNLVESTETEAKGDQAPKVHPKAANLTNLKRALQAVKKAVVYLKIESKSRDSIEDLIDLANSLLADTLTSEQRLKEYFLRYPNVISSSKSIKYRLHLRPEDSYIELALTKILRRQDDLFAMKKGVSKIVGLLQAVARVYGRYEHPTVFIHTFESVGFAVEFVECIVDGLLEGKKPKPITLLMDLLDCLHELRSVSKVGRTTQFTTVLMTALEASKHKLLVTDIVQIYTKWVLMHSSTEMNEYTTQIEQVNDFLLQMYKETREFKSGMIPLPKQLGLLHALAKSKILDREILFETLQGFLKEGFEALDHNLTSIRRFFRCLSMNYFVIAQEPKLLNILHEHITAQLPELKEALKKSPDARDRRYTAISIIYSLAVLFPPNKIGLHAEYLLGEVTEAVDLSLVQGYTKPEVLMLGGILELLKGVWTFPGDLGVRIIQLAKSPGFFRLPTPSMAAFEVADILGQLKIKHRMEVNLGHMVVDIIVESTLPGEIELAIDVHGPPHEFRNIPITLGNQQFKSRLLSSVGIGYFQIPLHVWSLLDLAGKKSYLLKGIRVLRDKGHLGPEDPAKDVADPDKIVMKNPKKKSEPTSGTQTSSKSPKTPRKSKKTKESSDFSPANSEGLEPDSNNPIQKKPRASRAKKNANPEAQTEPNKPDLSGASLDQEPQKPKRTRKSTKEAKPAADSDQPKPKRARKTKSAEEPIAHKPDSKADN